MKRINTIFMGLFLLIGGINAQVVQHGVVLQYNGKQEKTPLEGVSLVVRGTGSTTSEKGTGSFTLSFNTLKAGDRLSFRDNTPALKGYEVYNKETIESWNISPSQPFEVVMVDSEYFNNMKGELKKNTRAYYEEELSKVKQELGQALAQNRIQQEEYDRKILEAEDEFYEKLKNIDNYIDQFVRIDLSTIKPAEQHILDLVSQGKFDAAIKAYEDLRLIDKYEQAVKNRNDKLEAAAKLQESAGHDSQQMDSIYQSLKNQVKTYQLAGGKENFDKAGSILKRIALSDTTNFSALAEYADFSSEQNDYKEAEIFYLRCLELLYDSEVDEDTERLSKFNPDAYEPNLARTQMNLSNLYQDIQRYSESESMYKSAFDIYECLSKVNPDAYEPRLAALHMNLGILYQDIQRYSESEAMYKSALEIYERLSKFNPDAYEPYLAMTQMNLGNLYQVIQRYSESESMYKSALETYEHLSKVNPDTFEPDMAMTQMNLGNLYFVTQRFGDSESMYKSSLEIRERLSKVNPDAFEPYLAATQVNLGVLYNETQRYAESESMYKSSLEIYERLSKVNPDAYEPDLARTQMNLGILYNQTQRYAESESMYKSSIEIRERLSKVNPDVYEPDLARTQMNLGNLFKDIQRYTEGESMYKSALDIYERLSKVNPDAYDPDLATTQVNLGILYSYTQHYTESESMYKSALDIYEHLSMVNPDAFEPYLAKTHMNFGYLYYLMQRYAESEEEFLDALSVSGCFADSNLFVSETNQMSCHYWLGQNCIQLGRIQESIKSFELSLALARQYIQMGMGTQEYLESLYYLSLLMASVKEYEAAYNYNKELLSTLAVIYESDLAAWGNPYCEVLSVQSFYSNLLNRFEEGEHYSRKALKVDPDHHIAYTNLAAALLFQGKVEEAERIYRQYGSELKDAFLEDFVEYERVGVIPEERKADVERIKVMLNEE